MGHSHDNPRGGPIRHGVRISNWGTRTSRWGEGFPRRAEGFPRRFQAPRPEGQGHATRQREQSGRAEFGEVSPFARGAYCCAGGILLSKPPSAEEKDQRLKSSAERDRYLLTRVARGPRGLSRAVRPSGAHRPGLCGAHPPQSGPDRGDPAGDLPAALARGRPVPARSWGPPASGFSSWPGPGPSTICGARPPAGAPGSRFSGRAVASGADRHHAAGAPRVQEHGARSPGPPVAGAAGLPEPGFRGGSLPRRDRPAPRDAARIGEVAGAPGDEEARQPDRPDLRYARHLRRPWPPWGSLRRCSRSRSRPAVFSPA